MIVAVALTVMVVMLVVMAVTLAIMVVLVPVLMVVIVAVALTVVVVMLVVMVMAVAFNVLVQLVVEAGVVDGVEHPVPEFMLVDVDDGAHESEAHLLHGLEGAVVLDPVVEVGEVQGHAGAVLVDDGGLDVPEEAAGFLGDPFPDGQEGARHPGLGVGVPADYASLQPYRASARVVERGVLVLMVVIVAVAFLVVSAHLIIS